MLQAQGGQPGEVDGASPGQDVGQDAFVAAAAGFSTSPGPTGEVADLAFHHGLIRPVVLLPGRIPLAGFGVLQGGFLRFPRFSGDFPTRFDLANQRKEVRGNEEVSGRAA